MATNFTIKTAYKGEPAGKIFGQIFLKANTIEKGLINVIPNIPSELAYLRKTNLDEGFSDYSCNFEPSGDLNLTEKEVKLKKLQLSLEICKEEFRRRWSASQMGFSAWNNQGIPADENEALMLEVAGQIQSRIEKMLWNGVTGAGQFQGLMTELKADATANKVDGDALTDANIIEALGKVLDATPIEVLQHEGFRLVMDFKTHLLYKRALGKLYFGQDDTVFEGYKIETANGLQEGSILTYVKDEVHFLTGLESDINEIIAKDMTEIDLSDNIRIKATFVAGASYVEGKNVTFYNVVTTP